VEFPDVACSVVVEEIEKRTKTFDTVESYILSGGIHFLVIFKSDQYAVFTMPNRSEAEPPLLKAGGSYGALLAQLLLRAVRENEATGFALCLVGLGRWQDSLSGEVEEKYGYQITVQNADGTHEFASALIPSDTGLIVSDLCKSSIFPNPPKMVNIFNKSVSE